MKLSTLTLIFMLGLSFSCKRSSKQLPVRNASVETNTNDAEQMSDLIEAEESKLETDTEATDKAISELKAQLAQSEKLSQEEKLKIEKQLAEAEAKRLEDAKKLADLQQQQKLLEEQNKALQDKLKNGMAASSGNTIANRNVFYNDDCIDVVNASKNDGANIVVKPCDGSLNQNFSLEFIDSMNFRLIAKHSNKCAYSEGATLNNGANIQQLSCKRNGDPFEVFRFKDINISKFKIQNTGSGKCFKIQDNGNLSQNDCATSYSEFEWADAAIK